MPSNYITFHSASLLSPAPLPVPHPVPSAKASFFISIPATTTWFQCLWVQHERFWFLHISSPVTCSLPFSIQHPCSHILTMGLTINPHLVHLPNHSVLTENLCSSPARPPNGLLWKLVLEAQLVWVQTAGYHEIPKTQLFKTKTRNLSSAYSLQRKHEHVLPFWP